MKTLLFIALLTVPTLSAAQEDTRQTIRTIIPTCPAESIQSQQLCQRELRVRRAARAIGDILTIGADGGTGGPAAECAATAEDHCGVRMERVDTLEFDGEVCVFSCIAFDIE
jgi:hypothetical protein